MGKERQHTMGADVTWINQPLDGRISTDIQEGLATHYLQPDPPDREPWEGINRSFQFAASFGSYFRADGQTWSMIVAEMEQQGMLDGQGIPSARLFNNTPITPAEITGALATLGEVLPTMTNKEAATVAEVSTTEMAARALGTTEGKVDTYLEAKVAEFPLNWVRWLCFMERAASLGGGFSAWA